MRPTIAQSHSPRQILRTERGRIYRCGHCDGLHFQFGHVSAVINADSFLRLANMIHYAATDLGPNLIGDEQIVIPFSPNLSLLLDSEDLADIHRLVQDGLKWLDGPEETAPVHVN